MITAGIDCGARNTKTILLKEGKIIGKGSVLTGFDQGKAVEQSFERALETAGVTKGDIEKIAGTGAGKNAIKMAATKINDIRAMAKACHFFFPNARTVADVGAEEGRAVKMDENGGVVDFVINEKCAAGAGIFIEAMSKALEVSMEEMGPLALKSDTKIPMNAQCVVFAESEVVGLIHARTEKADISKAIHDAVVNRVVSMIRRVGINEDVVLIGGVGRNPAFIHLMRQELRVENLYVPDGPEFGAAVGAAVVAEEEG